MWRTDVFPSMTMASSTTKPTERVSQKRDVVQAEPEHVHGGEGADHGHGARLGMTVAGMLRKKRKMTITTRQTVSIRVNFTSATDSRMEVERS